MQLAYRACKQRVSSFVCCAILATACGKDTLKIETRPEPVDADAIPGERGPVGPQGPVGEPGEAGPANAIVLYDAHDVLVGYKFRYDLGEPADIFRIDGSRAMIDLDTGELRAPLFDFFCLYVEQDCEGSCYVYDQRWVGMIILGQDDQLFLAARGSDSVGSIDVLSYKHDDGSCQNTSLGTIESFQAEPYEDNDFIVPLPAPLYWGMKE